jgi:hypothetical protein
MGTLVLETQRGFFPQKTDFLTRRTFMTTTAMMTAMPMPMPMAMSFDQATQFAPFAPDAIPARAPDRAVTETTSSVAQALAQTVQQTVAQTVNKTAAALHLIQSLPGLLSFHARPAAESFRFSQLEGGLPKGAVVEVSGPSGGGKTEVVLRFLSENPEARVAWIEDELTVYPCAFPQNRVGLERVLFVESRAAHQKSADGRVVIVGLDETLWTAHQILRSQVFGVVVLRVAKPLEEMALRRLQLAAEKTQTTLVLLVEEPARRGTWPIAVQLRATRSAEERAILLDVIKYRGQKSWQVRVG